MLNSIKTALLARKYLVKVCLRMRDNSSLKDVTNFKPDKYIIFNTDFHLSMI